MRIFIDVEQNESNSKLQATEEEQDDLHTVDKRSN